MEHKRGVVNYYEYLACSLRKPPFSLNVNAANKVNSLLKAGANSWSVQNIKFLSSTLGISMNFLTGIHFSGNPLPPDHYYAKNFYIRAVAGSTHTIKIPGTFSNNILRAGEYLCFIPSKSKYLLYFLGRPMKAYLNFWSENNLLLKTLEVSEQLSISSCIDINWYHSECCFVNLSCNCITS